MATQAPRRQAPKPPTGSCRWLTRPAGFGRAGVLEVTTTHTAAGVAVTVYEVTRLAHPETGFPVGWQVRPLATDGRPVDGEGYRLHDGSDGLPASCDCPAAVYYPGECKHRKCLTAALAALAR